MIKYSTVLVIVALLFCCNSKAEMHKRIKKTKDSVSFSTVFLVNEHSEVLLLRRIGTGFADGLYALPGGKIESGETALEAAIREAQEEVGVTAEGLNLVHVINRQGPETEFYVFVFKPTKWLGTPINGEPDKCDAMHWFSLNTLPENILPAHRQAIDLIKQGISYSEHGYT